MPRDRGLNTCRLCLGRTPTSFSLLNGETARMLRAVAAVMVCEADSSPKGSCLSCLLDLRLAFRIQQRILAADRTLKSGYEQAVETEPAIKLEDLQLSRENGAICNFIEGNKSPPASEAAGSDSGEAPEEMEESVRARDPHWAPLFIEENKSSTPSEASGDDLDEASKETGELPTAPHLRWVPHFCQLCNNREFPSRRSYMIHLNNHKRKSCPICGKKLSITNFSKHIQAVHSEQRVHCDVCGKLYKNLESLRLHKILTHGTRNFKCQECGACYMSQRALKEHNLTSHNKSGPQCICEICGLKFFTKKQLSRHRGQKHLITDTPRPCPVCGKLFCTPSQLKSHMTRHTKETPYRCHECGEAFRQNVSLKGHLRSKHSIEEEKGFICKDCGKAFGSNHALKMHVRLHF